MIPQKGHKNVAGIIDICDSALNTSKRWRCRLKGKLLPTQSN